MVLDLRIGDVLRMRRKHPCGAEDWTVVRVGADIGLVCSGCSRRILMSRDTVRRRARAVVERGTEVDPAVWQALEESAGGAVPRQPRGEDLDGADAADSLTP